MGNKQSASQSAPASSRLQQQQQQVARSTGSTMHHMQAQRQLSVDVNRFNRRASDCRNRGGGGGTDLVADRPNGGAPVTVTVETSNSFRMAQNRRRSSSAAALGQRGGGVKPKRLTPRQCQLIIKSWSKKPLPRSRVTKEIFTVLFTEAEDLKAAFGLEDSLKGKKLRADPRFVSHVERFTDTFDFIIRHLDDFSLITEHAEELGKSHAARQIENFRNEYWTMFAEAIVDQASAGDDREVQLAWRQLVLTLIFYMKLGFDRESLRISRGTSVRVRATLPQQPMTA